MFTKELLRIAYKKLKSYVFFDKTQLPLRDKIVAFETENFEEILDRIAEELYGSLSLSQNEFGLMTNEILNNINCYVLPKKLLQQDETNSKNAHSNLQPDCVKIKDCQYYIDMDVLGHVLGVAWILLIGNALDKNVYENSYGNRLKKNLNFNDDLNYSPYLFEPYFSQYESWRDKGLEQAKKLLQNDKNVIMMTLDFSRFYYSLNIEFDKLNEIVDKACAEKHLDNLQLALIWHLTDFIYRVIEIYSEKVGRLNEKLVGNRKILPIGFAPSNILSNVCLKGFDDAIIKGWNPTYFGRYVDDVLIIDKVEKNSPIYEYAKNQTISTESALDYYLTNCDAWRKQYSKCEENDKRGLFKKNKIPNESAPKGYDAEYVINDGFLDFNGCVISLQNKKAKVFYFDSSQSDVLLRCFQKNLQKNISEFRYMPEDEPIFNFNDYTEIYKIRENAGPNKLNGVEDFGLDKFELSKFLGKYMRISGLIEDKKESRFKKDIAKIFTGDVIIENYSTWEKIFAILINNEYFEELEEFVGIILKAIAAANNVGESEEELRRNKIDNLIKISLIDFLYSGLSRSLSLVWGKRASDISKNLEDQIFDFCSKNKLKIKREIGINKIRKYYCLSRMCDKYSMPLLIDEVIEGDKINLKDDGDLVNLTSFSSFLRYLSDKDKKCNLTRRRLSYIYYPYVISVADLTFANMINSLINNEPEKLNCSSEELYKLFYNFNYNKNNPKLTDSKFFIVAPTGKEKILKSFVKVGADEYEKINVAVANTELDDNLLIDILRNKYDRTYDRYNNLVKMVNEAIANKTNMLVLPEGYLPIGWLPIFARTCAKNQLAAVVGLEHFIIKDYVYNITATILPYTDDDYKFVYINFHRKTHYAPDEKMKIESAGKKISEGKEVTLFNWNDFWFPVYCCYELTSIKERAIFQSFADAIIAVEWNKDVNYYSNIVESLSRDLHCYCIQVNMSKYGDSRITQPTKTEKKDILRVKGGKNSIVLIDEIDVAGLRDFQLLGNMTQKELKDFKVTPPNFENKIVQLKKDKKLWNEIKAGAKNLF